MRVRFVPVPLAFAAALVGCNAETTRLSPAPIAAPATVATAVPTAVPTSMPSPSVGPTATAAPTASPTPAPAPTPTPTPSSAAQKLYAVYASNVQQYNLDGSATGIVLRPASQPAAATVAANGKIYVIGLTARNGTMTQFLGRIDIFDANGISTSSPINTPLLNGSATSGFTGIAVDGAGKIYVSTDTEVFSTSADGTPSTPTITGLTKAEGVAVDTTGKIYVTDLGANKVMTFDSTGTPTSPTISVSSPHGIVFNSGKLYVTSDRPVNTLTTYLANGTASTPTISTGLVGPQGIAVDATGKIYVQDSGSGNVLTFTPNGMPTTPTFAIAGPIGIAM